MGTAVGQIALDAASAGVELLSASCPAPLASATVAATWMSEAQLRALLTQVGRARSALAILEAALVGEGLSRGLPGDEGLSPVDWVRTHEGAAAVPPDPAEAARVVRQAQIAARRGSVCDPVLAAFAAGELSARKTDQVLKFIDEVAAVADPDELAGIVQALIDGAGDGAVPGVRAVANATEPLEETDADAVGPDEDADSAPSHIAEGPDDGHDDDRRATRGGPAEWGLLPRELAAAIRHASRLLKPERQLEDEERESRRGCAMFKGAGPGDLSEYRILADAEGCAILDSAVAALSAPVPGPNGEADLRSPARRRYDALMDLVSRGIAAGGDLPRTNKAQVIVTTTLESLLDKLRGVGVTMTGEVLSPEAVRRLACDAEIVPMMLGSDGQPLDVGRSKRLFTGAQRLALWRRDHGCTFPGCTVPATWCDAHHVVHWSRGGPTNLGNAALLCRRHHTFVHSEDLGADVTDVGVTWRIPRLLAAS